ncbi:glycosyltransferase [Marinobacter oulmenensis]|uniref:Glycosyltransferase involved in cell wall biosynthesis n=1 Tax=Marinobacter oulmenensis TaxID=643747 RepID=A0A840UBQ8_9GAMM|nr:glycosyltransferase [Marinobacter oulmenensis]MBB5320690.1 glycosyltransferase involved in cell wall biosynthesis [Marinobacter oulmenensis]
MGFGGTEQVIRQLIGNLAPDCFECEIACIDGGPGEIGQQLARDRGIVIHAKQRKPGFDKALVRWLHGIIRKGKFDVVHGHQYSPFLYAWLAHWMTGTRMVFTEHGRFHPDRHRKKARFINPFIARSSHALVAISEATREALAEYEYMPPSKIQVIYNGIEPPSRNPDRERQIRAELQLTPDDIVLGTVARLDPVKNQALLLTATRRLRDEGYPVRLLLVGDGPEREKLETQARELSLEKSVVFTGFQENPADYLGLMDVFLLPSFTEGTSMTLLEAMSLGVPVIASRVGGTPEIVEHEKTGFLFDSGDEDGLLKAVKTLLDDPEAKRQMTTSAWKRFQQRFSARQMADQYQSLYLVGR